MLRLTSFFERQTLRSQEALPDSHLFAIPPAWFLPGPVCMRGGAARHFASDRQFHRGSQAESTFRANVENVTHFQRLGESRSRRAGFFCGIQGSQFAEATTPEASQRKPPAGKLLNLLYFFI